MIQPYFLRLLGCLLACLLSESLFGQAFVTNGSATALGGDCYQLTPDVSSQTGNIFTQDPIDLNQPFYIEASLFFGCKDANGADGIVFILAATNNQTGGLGIGIGYEGITPSIAIEYDDYFNGEVGDPVADHMSIISMGSVDHTLPSCLVSPIDIPDIEDCMVHCFAIAWDPVLRRLQASLDDNNISFAGDIITDIFGGNDQVYFGFSAGTGGLSNLQRVCFGPPLVEEMPDAVICDGESTVLEADPNGIAWTWAPDPTLSSLDESDPTATPTETTTYTTIIEYKCGYFGYDTVTVTVNPPPQASASNNGPICEGDDLLLMAEGGNSYIWEGPDNFTSFNQNPIIPAITIDQSGTYTVTVTDADGCTSTASTEVDVDGGPAITIEPWPDPICQDFDPFQLIADPSGGVWEGDISPGGLFNPGIVGEGIHTITYTVANANGCENSEEINIEVYANPEVLIDPPGTLCETSPGIQLSGTPPGGVWEGEVTIGGVFDPGSAGEGPHLISYIAEDANGCTNIADITIDVLPGLFANISPEGPFCTSEESITLIADPPGGEWGGEADQTGTIYPSILGSGFHLVTYTFADQEGCYYGQENIQIIETPNVSIDAIGPLCADAPTQTLTALPAGGIWSGSVDASGQFDPVLFGPGVHEVIYSVTFSGGCADADTIYVEVFPTAPFISNLSISCDPTSTFYTVTFSITGGDAMSYVIDGTVPGALMPGSPAIFISDPLPSGDPYMFWVNDVNNCDPDTISGTELCNCTTNAGTMSFAAINACVDDPIIVLPPSGVSLDPDDSLVYVLHLGFPDNILMVNDSLQFNFGPPLLTGVTYFVSSVAGNGATGIGVDLSDPCLSVSFGTPVMWVDNPSGTLTGTIGVCEGEGAALTFLLSGTGPFDVTYTDGTDTLSLEDILSGHSVMVLPQSTTTYTLLEVSETTTPICSGTSGATFTIEVFDNYLTAINSEICFGDSLFVGGAWQKESGLYVDGLFSSSGCDSTIETTLTVHALDTTYASDTSCDPMQVGMFTDIFTDQRGCDSTTITTVTWVLADTTLLQTTTCDEAMAGIFTDMYTGQSGCDSVVIETINYVPPDSTWISGQTCEPGDAGTFIEVQMNTAGCDSFTISTILLISADTTFLAGETCIPNEAGTFMQLFTNTGGCDSLVIETISLLPSDTTIIPMVSCLPEEVGTVEQIMMNVFGCDSLLWTITSLAPEDSCIVPEVHREIYFPNVFSPNGDGINDYFFLPSHPEAVEKFPVLRIYDRWGGLVFERIDMSPNVQEQGWDGTFKDQPINPGVFVWAAEVEYKDGKVEMLTGDVTLVR